MCQLTIALVRRSMRLILRWRGREYWFEWECAQRVYNHRGKGMINIHVSVMTLIWSAEGERGERGQDGGFGGVRRAQ